LPSSFNLTLLTFLFSLFFHLWQTCAMCLNNTHYHSLIWWYYHHSFVATSQGQHLYRVYCVLFTLKIHATITKSHVIHCWLLHRFGLQWNKKVFVWLGGKLSNKVMTMFPFEIETSLQVNWLARAFTLLECVHKSFDSYTLMVKNLHLTKKTYGNYFVSWMLQKLSKLQHV